MFIIFTEALSGICKFRQPYKPLYIFNSSYLILPFKRTKNIKPLPTLEIMDHEINETIQ